MDENLIEAIQRECARVRCAIPHYAELGPVGLFGKTMLEQSVAAGEAAIASGDVIQMITALQHLRGCEK